MWREADPEQSGVAVIGARFRCLDPPLDVAVKHPVGFEQVLFVSDAHRQHPLVLGDDFGDFVGSVVPVPARDDQDAAIDAGRISFAALKLQAGVIQVVGEQQVQQVLVPLVFRG